MTPDPETDGSASMTQLLADWAAQDANALDRLVPLVYDELRRLANYHMRGERTEHTLQTTALVHEVYLRLAGIKGLQWRDRAHFFAPSVDVEALDEALQRLSGADPQQCRIVELRFFGGLSIEETAEALGISPAIVKRDWTTAKAWLHHELTAP